MTIFDISSPISPELAVWPGDAPVRREVHAEIARGSIVTVSSYHASLHVGTHADAPSHYGRNGLTIEQLPLGRFMGRCRVVDVACGAGVRIVPPMLRGPVDTERVLLKTGTYPDHRVFSRDFAAPSPELIDHLADRGVTLIGVDTPSVDLFTDKQLVTHAACLRRGMLILEGLRLAEVPAGVYRLVALPLKIVGGDGSPVRAVLLPDA
ncbi:MAG: cyclase family protein [Phycisphaerales bacterium]|nr:cyclase family protein [Phycisphaerales bacterium]